MRIEFSDGGYIELQNSGDDKMFVIISAVSANNPNEKIVNSAELTKEEFLSLANEFLPKQDEKKTKKGSKK